MHHNISTVANPEVVSSDPAPREDQERPAAHAAVADAPVWRVPPACPLRMRNRTAYPWSPHNFSEWSRFCRKVVPRAGRRFARLPPMRRRSRFFTMYGGDAGKVFERYKLYAAGRQAEHLAVRGVMNERGVWTIARSSRRPPQFRHYFSSPRGSSVSSSSSIVSRWWRMRSSLFHLNHSPTMFS